MKRYLQLINNFYLALVILWEPLQRGFLHIDGKGRIVFLLTIFVLLVNVFYDKRFLKKEILSKPALFWGLWVVYSAINHYFNGYYGALSFEYYFVILLLQPFVVLVIATKETMRNPIKTVLLFTVVFTVFGLLSVTVLGGESEKLGGRVVGDLGNAGPLNTIYIVFYAALLFVHKRITLKVVLPLIIFAFAVITLAATRKAFGAISIIAFALIFSQIKITAKNVVLTIFLALFFYFGVNYALENSVLGERFDEGMEVGEENNITNIESLSFLGDRVSNYIIGWDLFKKNPINGIGLQNYYYKGHGALVIHSEYIVQLAECGIIGTLLFLLFYFWIGRELIKLWRKNSCDTRPVIWLLIGGFVAVVFINFTAWTYQFSQYFAAFGVMTGYIKYLKQFDNNSRNRQKRFKSPMS